MSFLFLKLNAFLMPYPGFVRISREAGKHQNELLAGSSFNFSTSYISQGMDRKDVFAPSTNDHTPRISIDQIDNKANKRRPNHDANNCQTTKNPSMFICACNVIHLEKCPLLNSVQNLRQAIVTSVARFNCLFRNRLDIACKKAIAVFERFAFFHSIIEVDKRQPQPSISLSKCAFWQTKPACGLSKREKFVLLRNKQMLGNLRGYDFEFGFFKHLNLLTWPRASIPSKVPRCRTLFHGEEARWH